MRIRDDYLAEITGIVVANIGAGKSEFMRTLEKRKAISHLLPLLSNCTELKVVEEDPKVFDLVARKFIPALKDKDPERLLAAEIDIAQARFEQYQRISMENGIWLLERSLYEDRFVFTESLYDGGKGILPEQYYKAYTLFVDEMFKLMAPPDIVIYLHTDPEVAFARVQARGREFEKEYDLPYLTRLHNLYVAMAQKTMPLMVKDPNKIVPINANKHLTPEELEAFHRNIEWRIAVLLKQRGFSPNGNGANGSVAPTSASKETAQPQQ